MGMAHKVPYRSLAVCIVCVLISFYEFHFASLVIKPSPDSPPCMWTITRKGKLISTNVLQREWMNDDGSQRDTMMDSNKFPRRMKNHRRTFALQKRHPDGEGNLRIEILSSHTKNSFLQLSLSIQLATTFQAVFIMLMFRIIIIKIHQILMSFSERGFIVMKVWSNFNGKSVKIILDPCIQNHQPVIYSHRLESSNLLLTRAFECKVKRKPQHNLKWRGKRKEKVWNKRIPPILKQWNRVHGNHVQEVLAQDEFRNVTKILAWKMALNENFSIFWAQTIHECI